MSVVELRVELPAYSHSFLVQVSETSTISDLKAEIARICPGAPQVHGQRIIWRGRTLRDEENVSDLWKSPDEPRIVHLAVHPSAWTSAPPDIPPVSQSAYPQVSSLPRATQTQPQHIYSHSTTTSSVHSLAYILFRHQNALIALLQGKVVHGDIADLQSSRTLALQAVQRNGWLWPDILDEEFPPAIEGGLKYEPVDIDGQSYLSLRNPGVTPTPIQTHALKVLTYTFPLLSTSVDPSGPRISSSGPVPPHLNQILQQLGLPHAQLRAAPNQNLIVNQIHDNQIHNGIRAEMPGLPLRPFLAPILMLVFRTLLLLYFVAPARKPIFGILLVAWMLYEIWQPIRDGLLRGWRRVDPQVQGAAPGPAGPAGNGAQAQEAQQRAPVPIPARPGAAGGAPAGNAIENQVLDGLANMNIQREEETINQAPGANIEEPGLWHKTVTFINLLAITLHPAVWNRRRVALRQREGRIRTEANGRRPPNPDEEESPERAEIRANLIAQHLRRPAWVRRYMERVLIEDWVDDSD